MAKLPEEIKVSPTVLAIYAAYKAAEKQRPSRRLGASVIGQECPRRIWYSFRWSGSENFDGKTLRLFETGNREEPRFVANLRSIGCEVWDVDESGYQFEYTAVSGHVVAKLDSVLVGIPEAPKAYHAGEFKTHGDKSFKALQKDGLRKSKPDHWAQLAVGMRLADLARGLYLGVNKNTDELYAERLRAEEIKDDVDKLLAFAETIIKSDRAPERIGDKDSFACKWCPFHALCHGGEASTPAVPCKVTCRSCCHSTAVIEEGGNGRWRCEKHNKTIGEADQAKACPDHLFIPDFITFAEPIDGADEPAGAWAEYRNADGTTWKQGKRDGQYKSIELTILPAPLVGAGTVDNIKTRFGGEVVEMEGAA